MNCLTAWRGGVAYTAFGDFTEAHGYSGLCEGAGFLRDLLSGETLITGLTQPHSPTPFRGGLLVANSAHREIRQYDADLSLVRQIPLGDYTRGILVADEAVYVGLSGNRKSPDPSRQQACIVALHPESLTEIGRYPLPSVEVYGLARLPDPETAIDVLQGLMDLTDEMRLIRSSETGSKRKPRSQKRRRRLVFAPSALAAPA